MTPAWVKPVAVGLVIGLLLGIALGRGRAPDPVVLHRIDSVLVEGPGVRDSLATLARSTLQSQRQALQLHGEAARLRRVADSLINSGKIAITVPANQPAIESAIDSASSVPATAYIALDSAYQTLELAYQNQMEATAHLTAALSLSETRIGTLETTLRLAQSELKRTRRPSRFGVGMGAGYGAVVTGGVVRAGPALTVGVTVRLF